MQRFTVEQAGRFTVTKRETTDYDVAIDAVVEFINAATNDESERNALFLAVVQRSVVDDETPVMLPNGKTLAILENF